MRKETRHASAVPGLVYEVSRIASSVYFIIRHEPSGQPMYAHGIRVKGGGGVTRMMRVANAIFGRAGVDWTRPAGQLDVAKGTAAAHEFEAWLEPSDAYGNRRAREGAPEER